MRNHLVISVYLFASIVLLSCNIKSQEERIMESIDKETCKDLLNEVLLCYMPIEWDSINFQVIKPYNILAPMLMVDGYGRCIPYANERFNVASSPFIRVSPSRRTRILKMNNL